MRKILLATTAVVGVALCGAAQAAESPLTVTVGGYVDFRAAQFNESRAAVVDILTEQGSTNTARDIQLRDKDFETQLQINIEAAGKANNGVEYGAKIGLWNNTADENLTNSAAGDSLNEHDAYVWLSGKFGKVVFGDSTGATTDMMVFAPTVGEGQIDGSFDHFLYGVWTPDPTYLSDDENSTKVTFYTPKVGSENHKVQLGVSYTPNYGEKGRGVTIMDADGPDYRDMVGGALQYTGKFGPVSTVVAATINSAQVNGESPETAGNAANVVSYRDFTTYGIGAQAAYAGFTVGGSFVDAGRVDSTMYQKKAQNVWTAGVKYEAGKVAVAANYLAARGYVNSFSDLATTVDASNTADSYARGVHEVGLGATYTWFPGLTTAADVVLFNQKMQQQGAAASNIANNSGSVLMLSQKLAF